jgi:IS5 family transposase
METFTPDSERPLPATAPAPDELVSWARSRLGALLPPSWTVTRARGVDGGPTLILGAGALSTTYLLVTRDHLTAGAARRLGQEHTGAPLLVVAPWLGDAAREALRSVNINYLDRTGALWLRGDAPAVAFDLPGARHSPWPPPPHAARERGLASVSAARLVRALCDYRPPYGLREIAAVAQLLPGTAAKLLDRLAAEGLVARDPPQAGGRYQGAIRSVDWPRLLARWGADRAPRLLGTYIEPRGLGALLARLATLEETEETLYQTLLRATRQTVPQAVRVRATLASLLPAASVGQESHRQLAPATQRGLRLQAQLDHFLPLIERVIAQAQARVLEGRQVPASEKVLSLFEPHTRLIPRHKGGAAVEFGRQVMLAEVEGGIVPHYHVLTAGESDRHQAIPAVVQHRRLFGRAPWLLTGDRGVHAKGVEEQAQALGVRHVAIPRSGPTTQAQRAREHSRDWRRRSRWRAGIEGRISSLRRDYGLARCAYHGEVGLERWVGWGVVASNLRQIGRQLAPARERQTQAA